MRIATCCVSQHRNWLRIATKCERQQVAHRNSLLRIATACCDPRPVQLANLKRHPHRPLWSALLRGGGRLKTRNTFRGVGIIQTCGGTSESAPPPHSSSSARIPVRPQHAGARRHWLVRRGPGGSDQQPPAGAEILTGAAPPGKLRFCTACKRAGRNDPDDGRPPAKEACSVLELWGGVHNEVCRWGCMTGCGGGGGPPNRPGTLEGVPPSSALRPESQPLSAQRRVRSECGAEQR